MISRRVLLGTGVVAVGAGGLVTAAQLTHRLDDVADAVGLRPKPLPDSADTRIVREAAAATVAVLASAEATAALHPGLDLASLLAVLREQVAAVGGDSPAAPAASPSITPPSDVTAAVRALEDALTAGATARATDAQRAGSAELVRVLASMSAGHAQSARAVRRLR